MLGRLLTENGFTVSSGGYEGIMAAVSQGAYEAGGRPIGVTSTRVENSRGAKPNRWIAREIRYESLEDRLHYLVTENDGMVVLGGGVGTLSELALAWSLLQVGEVSQRPLVLVGKLWADFLSVFVHPEFIPDGHLQLVKSVMTVEQAASYLLSQIEVVDQGVKTSV
jgi:uncharacterized protein (TIGR00725 family)